jgi:hypothetical protein
MNELIPTRYKEKLPKEWSYPVGAEIISHHLSGIKLPDPIDICFNWRGEYWHSKYQKTVKTLGDIKILECRSSLFHSGLALYVYGVPSKIKEEVRSSFDKNVFPILYRWLSTENNKSTFVVLLNLKTNKIEIRK